MKKIIALIAAGFPKEDVEAVPLGETVARQGILRCAGSLEYYSQGAGG